MTPTNPKTSSGGKFGFLVALATGIWLGLTELKFGNPIIFSHLIEPPADLLELIYHSWPTHWGFAFSVIAGGLGAAHFLLAQTVRPNPGKHHWILFLPLVWFGWQLLSATQTVEPRLTHITLKHFAACLLAFYLGCFSIGRLPNLNPLWIGLLVSFIFTLWVGFTQHFGGLEATRQYFYSHYPDLSQAPPELLKKISSNRIFATYVYPNSFAGAILLLLPILGIHLWQATGSWPFFFRSLAVGLLAYGSLAGLYWSGSKAGWLIALISLLVTLCRLQVSRRIKIAIACGLVCIGLAGFFFRYAAYFERGATSVGARFDYWAAAWETAKQKPLFGTGPGTFSVPYQKLKPPEGEMAKLTHNDYLEQASDSGLIGFFAYTSFVLLSLIMLYRKSVRDPHLYALWIGLFAWSIHSALEFNLYIPALAWPAFLFFGLLFSRPSS